MHAGAAVVVTGGAGYIGSHVCKALAESGYNPITYDNLEGGHRWAVQWGPLIEGDIHDQERLCSVFSQYQPLAVFHLASYINVRESLIHPGKYYDNNTQGTLALLQSMVRCDIKKLVFSSTASVFGHPLYLPIDEQHIKSPIHPYGKSKLMAEMIIEDFEKAHGIHSIYLRYFNASGADPSGLIGELHTPETHLIPLIMQTAIGQRDAIEIYGADYPTGDGTAVRDYIHVSDLADAHIKALNWLMQNSYSQHLNLGTGQGYSVKEVIDKIEEFSGKKIQRIIHTPSPDSASLIASATLAKEILNWHPKHSSLHNIVETAWRWHTK